MQSRLSVTVLLLLLYAGLSSAATVRLITIGPGEAFWSVYGHTALAIDDQVYGFGYFDFIDGSLITSFIANDMQYKMGISTFADELYYAQQDNRRFSVQVLDLSPLAVSRLQQDLARHYLPVNRSYQYDYFVNNCSTKIRDYINDATDGLLYQRAQNISDQSYADLTMPAYHQSAMHLGLALGYGSESYHKVSDWQSMAFPLALEQFMAQHMSDIIVAESTLYAPAQDSYPWLKNNAVYLALIALLLLAAIPVLRKVIICAWFCLFSVIGIVLIIMWLFSAHPIAANNFNILLANPLLFLACFKIAGRLLFVFLMISQILWLMLSVSLSACYLLPLAVINVIYLAVLYKNIKQQSN